MKRVQLFEFEDFAWFPKAIRTGMTNLIVVLYKMMGTSEVLAELIASIRAKQTFSQIVDMGSGSGGAMPEVIQQLNEGGESEQIKLLLTDLHPNPTLIKRFNASEIENVNYSENSLNATNLSDRPKGLKTMISSFHHMPPTQAKAILSSAQKNKESLLIYEIGENFVPLLLWWLLLPLSLAILFVMSLVMTPFVKPLTLKQIVFTYFIPIIPLCYAWDGQASLVRTYTFKDIEEMLKEIGDEEGYSWEVAAAKNKKGKKAGYYILGLPQ